jgi:hypothetical protein
MVEQWWSNRQPVTGCFNSTIKFTSKLCLNCIGLDTDYECDGNMQAYRVFGQIYQNGRRLVCRDPPGSCSWLACQCDVNMGEFLHKKYLISSTAFGLSGVETKSDSFYLDYTKIYPNLDPVRNYLYFLQLQDNAKYCSKDCYIRLSTTNYFWSRRHLKLRLWF